MGGKTHRRTASGGPWVTAIYHNLEKQQESGPAMAGEDRRYREYRPAGYIKINDRAKRLDNPGRMDQLS